MNIFQQEESKRSPNVLAKGLGRVSQLLKNGPSDKRVLNPAKELSGSKLTSIKEFLALLRRRREELHVEMQRIAEKLNKSHEENYASKILDEKKKTVYLLELVNMLLFHAHILLLKSDDRKLVTADDKLRLKDFFF